MKIIEIDKLITSKYPLKLQEPWDESGFRYLVERSTILTGVFVCLDLTKEIIESAIKSEINFIISHHPIFLKNKEVKPTKYELEMLKMLKDHKISFASYHTNIDNSPNGINMFIAKQLNLHQIKNINGTGIVTGKINFAYRPKVFASTLKNTFDLERIIYSSEELVKNIAICAGAGFNNLREQLPKLKDIDLFVTGDVKWHDWQFAKLHKIDVMDAGHDLENTFIELITELISENVKLIKIQTLPNKQDIKIVI
ncbi:MAG: Nif3-like dinuclear metal center hexameric protein [Mycoplasmataceae bacterium]|nr:Nif3-like dinuclear metal center hexameric protein [Mycoplasmataceae bacterium]